MKPQWILLLLVLATSTCWADEAVNKPADSNAAGAASSEPAASGNEHKPIKKNKIGQMDLSYKHQPDTHKPVQHKSGQHHDEFSSTSQHRASRHNVAHSSSGYNKTKHEDTAHHDTEHHDPDPDNLQTDPNRKGLKKIGNGIYWRDQSHCSEKERMLNRCK